MYRLCSTAVGSAPTRSERPNPCRERYPLVRRGGVGSNFPRVFLSISVIRHVEHDVRRYAYHLGGQHLAEEFPVLRRGREFRAAHGLDAGRTGQTHGQSERDSGKAVRNRSQTIGSGKRTGFSSETNLGQPSSGLWSFTIRSAVESRPLYLLCIDWYAAARTPYFNRLAALRSIYKLLNAAGAHRVSKESYAGPSK